MARRKMPDVNHVVGPDNIPLTVGDLPKSNSGRWGIWKKAQVVAAVRGGLISLDEVLQLYSLTVEEFLVWESQLDSKGYVGLGTAKVEVLESRDQIS